MSNDVTVKLKGDSKDLKRELANSESAVSKYAGAIKTALGVAVAAFAGAKVVSFAKDMIGLYSTQEAAEKKLANVIQATGGAAGYSLEQFKYRAAVLQEQIGIGDEVILNAQAILATFKEIKGDAFEEATVAAADMAAVLGGDVNGSIVQVGKALNDPIRGITALSRAGVSFTEQQKDMIRTLQESGDIMGAQRIILDELAGEFGGAAATAAKTFEGESTKVWNRIGDIGEVIGSLLIPALQAFYPVVDLSVTVLENLVNSLGFASEAGEGFAKTWSESFIEVFKSSVMWVTDTISTVETIFSNLGNIIERTAKAWSLTFVGFFEDLKHWFTVTAPEYVGWFADNFTAILTDIANFFATITTNMLNNWKDLFKGIWTLISTGSAEDFKFTPITEGFELTMKELPKIAQRELSNLEKSLAQDIKNLDNATGAAWLQSMEETEKFKEDLFTRKGPTPVDMTPNFDGVIKAAEKVAEKVKEDGKDAVQSVAKAAQEAEEAQESTQAGSKTGLEELADSIQQAAFEARGGSKNLTEGFVFQGRRDANDAAGLKAAKDADDIKRMNDALNGVGEQTKLERKIALRDKKDHDALYNIPPMKTDDKAKTDPVVAAVLSEIKSMLSEGIPGFLKALGNAGGVV